MLPYNQSHASQQRILAPSLPSCVSVSNLSIKISVFQVDKSTNSYQIIIAASAIM